MSIGKMFVTIFGIALLTLAVSANAQVTDQTARELARNAVRSRLNLKPDQFLDVRRDETLEQSLALAVGKRVGSEFMYRVSPTGDEIKDDAIVHHISTDADLVYIIAVNLADESTYRIHGFGDSATEFERLIAAIGAKLSSPEQAEYVADFYRRVNPKNIGALTPISSLIELKQAAERQCQTSSFDVGEEAFDAWWKRAKPPYAQVSFRQTAIPRNGGYIVEWIVLSSAAQSGNCGGAPLKARLEISSDGHVGKLNFSPLKKA